MPVTIINTAKIEERAYRRGYYDALVKYAKPWLSLSQIEWLRAWLSPALIAKPRLPFAERMELLHALDAMRAEHAVLEPREAPNG